LTVALDAAARAEAKTELVCEDVKHQQVHFSIDVSGKKLTYTDVNGHTVDYDWTDSMRNPYTDRVIHIHFGPPQDNFFLDFWTKPAGYAALFVGGIGPSSFTALCIIPGRIVQ